MLAIPLSLALVALGAAAPANPMDRARDKAAEKTEGKGLIEHQPVSWLKVYTLPIYRESWRLEGTVESLAGDLPRVREAFAQVGAAMSEAPEPAGKVRRLSFRCPKESAQKALAELKKIGTFSEPLVRQLVEPVSAPEVQAKVKALEADQAAHGPELARMPAVSALVEEMLGHLHEVEAALQKPRVEVLVHLTVKEKG